VRSGADEALAPEPAMAALRTALRITDAMPHVELGPAGGAEQ